MKLLVSTWIVCVAFSQSALVAGETAPQPTEVKTKLEAFAAKTGVVIILGFTKIGTISGQYGSSVTVTAKELTDASTGTRQYGITIEVAEGGRLERERTSYIDYDEIDSLLKGIDYIAKIDKKVTRLADFQAEYRTKGELEVSTFSSQKGGEIALAVQSGRVASATAYFNIAQLAELRKLIAAAKAKLETLLTPTP